MYKSEFAMNNVPAKVFFCFALIFLISGCDSGSSDSGSSNNSEPVGSTPDSGNAPNSNLIDGRYEIRGQGDIVYDHTTGLDWRRCALGVDWNPTTNTCVGVPNSYYVEELDSIGNLIPEGYRIPKLAELKTLVRCSTGIPQLYLTSITSYCLTNRDVGLVDSPTINIDAFPSTYAGFYLAINGNEFSFVSFEGGSPRHLGYNPGSTITNTTFMSSFNLRLIKE